MQLQCHESYTPVGIEIYPRLVCATVTLHRASLAQSGQLGSLYIHWAWQLQTEPLRQPVILQEDNVSHEVSEPRLLLS